MAHAYTPGLKVLHRTTVRKYRQLPLKGEVLLKEGDSVTPDAIVASASLPGNVEILNVAGLINVEPFECPECMLVKVGDKVENGSVIAESPGIFGLFKKICTSPIDGTLESISKVTGQAVLRRNPIPVDLRGYIQGRVAEVIEGQGLVVSSSAALIQGIFGIGGEQHGLIDIAVTDPGLPLEEDLLGLDQKGKVVVGGSYVSLDAFRKATDLGVAAIVVGGIDYHDLGSILGYALGVAITGSEELVTTLIVTEGFGRIAMAGRTHALLKEHAGHEASVNGATQIRAGVIRPEVIIPLAETGAEDAGKEESSGIEKGSLVRAIRAPYFGAIGQVTALPPELQVIETEAHVRSARVKFESGEEVLLPRANLERLETN